MAMGEDETAIEEFSKLSSAEASYYQAQVIKVITVFYHKNERTDLQLVFSIMSMSASMCLGQVWHAGSEGPLHFRSVCCFVQCARSYCLGTCHCGLGVCETKRQKLKVVQTERDSAFGMQIHRHRHRQLIQ